MSLSTTISAEYALRDRTKPSGVAKFTHLEKLPEEFQATLPALKEIEAGLGAIQVPES